MLPSRETLERLQASLGYQTRPLEIVSHLRELLRLVRKEPLLRERLALKGGTALNLCFGPPPRMSVDLDFNVIGDDALAERDGIVEALVRIGARQGYSVQRSRAEHAGQKFYLNFNSALGGRSRIEVDLNFLHRIALEPAEEREFWQPEDEDEKGVTCRVVSTAELVSGKLLALLDRGAPRDFYDTSRLNGLLPGQLDDRVRRVFVALAGTLPRPITEYGSSRLARLKQADVERTLYPVLRDADRPQLEQLTESAWAFVGPWLELRPEEREYSERVQVGELMPELIFPDDSQMADRLGRHPALLWKVKNSRAFTARGGQRSRPPGER